MRHTLIIFILSLTSLVAHATRGPSSICRAAERISNPSSIFSKGALMSPELITAYQEIKNEKPSFQTEDFIPTDVSGSNDSNLVMNKLADKSFLYLWNQSEIKKSNIGKALDNAEKVMTQEVVIRTSKVEHKIDFAVRAFESAAILRYKGYANAELALKPTDSMLRLSWTW